MTPYPKLRDVSLALIVMSGLSLSSTNLSAQDAAWEGLINAGQAALQQKKYAEAERHFESALETAEGLPPGDARLGKSLNNLAAVYYAQKDYARAEPLMRRSVAILEESLGPESTDVAQTMKNLAALYYLQGDFDAAEPLLKQSLAILEKVHGSNHAYVATVMSNLAGLYQAQNRYDDAEPLLSQSLEIWENLLGAEHPDVARSRDLLKQLREARDQAPAGETEVETAAEQAEEGNAASETAGAGQEAAEQEVAEEEPEIAADSSGEPGIDDEPLPSTTSPAITALIEEVKSDTTRDEPTPASKTQEPDVAASDDNQPARQIANPPQPTVQTASLEGIDRVDDATFAIHLSTLWSQDEAKRYWQSLQQELPDILDGKTMELEEIVAEGGQGSFYRVLTSPFTSDPDAQAACDRIKSELRTHDCSVVAR